MAINCFFHLSLHLCFDLFLGKWSAIGAFQKLNGHSSVSQLLRAGGPKPTLAMWFPCEAALTVQRVFFQGRMAALDFEGLASNGIGIGNLSQFQNHECSVPSSVKHVVIVEGLSLEDSRIMERRSKSCAKNGFYNFFDIHKFFAICENAEYTIPSPIPRHQIGAAIVRKDFDVFADAIISSCGKQTVVDAFREGKYDLCASLLPEQAVIMKKLCLKLARKRGATQTACKNLTSFLRDEPEPTHFVLH